MRIVLTVLGLLLSIVSAQADKVVASGKPLQLYQAYATNPDCSSAGTVVVRVAQPPAHGRISIRQTGVFPNFPAVNPRSACNRRRVPGVQAIYISERGYTGADLVVLQALFPAGRGLNITTSIHVM
jgi:hypothetical protein